MLAAGMPSLENHEGWGNRFVVLRIACIYYRSVSEKPHFSQRSREMGHPHPAKNARNGAPGIPLFAQTAKSGPLASRNRFMDPSTRKGRGSQDDNAVFKVWVSAGAEWASRLNLRSSFYSRSYSPRRASMGSVLEARLAGSAEAASASSSIATTESASTAGSNGLTSNRKERSKRDAATAPSKPNPQPTAASLAPELRISKITPERWQPSAMRTAISCSRNATENAMTP